MEDSNFLETLEESWNNLVDGFVEYTPRIVVALLLLLVGFLLAKFVSKWVAQLVDMIEKSDLVKRTTKSIGVKELDVDGIVRIFTYWAILLIFFSAAVDVLGLEVLTDTFNALISYIPNILAAAVIAALSLVAAGALYDVVLESAKKTGIKAYNFLAVATKVVVLVFGLTLAAAQLGLDLTVITNNITVVVAGFMLAFGLAFGLGGKNMAEKWLKDMSDGNWNK